MFILSSIDPIASRILIETAMVAAFTELSNVMASVLQGRKVVGVAVSVQIAGIQITIEVVIIIAPTNTTNAMGNAQQGTKHVEAISVYKILLLITLLHVAKAVCLKHLGQPTISDHAVIDVCTGATLTTFMNVLLIAI